MGRHRTGAPRAPALPRFRKKSMAFHDFDDYEELAQAAARVDMNTYVLVLLGGDAGLRLGEMMALEWSDVDLH